MAICGVCEFCQAGEQSLCVRFGIMGETRPGTFAEYFKVPQENVHPVPEGFSWEEAAAFPSTTEAVETVGGFQRREEPGFLSDLSPAQGAGAFAVDASQLPGLPQLQQIGLPQMDLSTFGREDIEAIFATH